MLSNGREGKPARKPRPLRQKTRSSQEGTSNVYFSALISASGHCHWAGDVLCGSPSSGDSAITHRQLSPRSCCLLGCRKEKEKKPFLLKNGRWGGGGNEQEDGLCCGTEMSAGKLYINHCKRGGGTPTALSGEGTCCCATMLLQRSQCACSSLLALGLVQPCCWVRNPQLPGCHPALSALHPCTSL